MTFDLHDALYGLRNLSVGDEEETRIGDYDDLPPALAALVEVGQYEAAYRQAIQGVLQWLTRDTVQTAVTAWVDTWNTEQHDPLDPDPDNDLTVDELMGVYDELTADTVLVKAVAAATVLDRLSASLAAGGPEWITPAEDAAPTRDAADPTDIRDAEGSPDPSWPKSK